MHCEKSLSFACSSVMEWEREVMHSFTSLMGDERKLASKVGDLSMSGIGSLQLIHLWECWGGLIGGVGVCGEFCNCCQDDVC